MAKKAEKAEKEKLTAELDKEGEDEKVADAKVDGELIQPIAFEITLKAIHPQASYGRCGYRFTKDKAVEIPFDALTGEQIIALSQDPYLEFVPVVEE